MRRFCHEIPLLLINSGTIAPGTDLGRICVIWYSCIFYPFSLVVVRDLGQMILIAMTRAYGKILIKIRWDHYSLRIHSNPSHLPLRKKNPNYYGSTLNIIFSSICRAWRSYFVKYTISALLVDTWQRTRIQSRSRFRSTLPSPPSSSLFSECSSTITIVVRRRWEQKTSVLFQFFSVNLPN